MPAPLSKPDPMAALSMKTEREPVYVQIAKLNKALENSSVLPGDVLRGVTCTNFVYEVPLQPHPVIFSAFPGNLPVSASDNSMHEGLLCTQNCFPLAGHQMLWHSQQHLPPADTGTVGSRSSKEDHSAVWSGQAEVDAGHWSSEKG